MLTTVVPFVAFAVILFSNYVTGTDISVMYTYGLNVAIMIVGFFYIQEKPAKTLATFPVLGVIAMAIGLFNTGNLAIYAFISGGLCCFIMWP